MEKKKGLSLQTILTIAGIALLYLLAFLLDRIPGVPIMLTTVLRKGAIYSLVAVSMNLLNGFTGLSPPLSASTPTGWLPTRARSST